MPDQDSATRIVSPGPARKNVLLLAHRVPYPPDKGDRIRTFHLLRFLSQHAAVSLACLADEPVRDDVLAALRRYCQRTAVVRLGPGRWLRALGSLLCGRTITAGAFQASALRRQLRAWARQVPFDVALASSSGMVPYLRLPELRDVPAVIDLVDVDSQKWLDYAAASRGWRAWLYRAEGRRLRRLEQDLPAWSRAVTLVSEAETALYRQFCAAGPVHAVTNGVDLDYFRPLPETDAPVCVFVGALDYLPNIDGARWFCHEVWPAIRSRSPEARLLLVGRRPAPAVRALRGLPGVELVGEVPDIRPHVARASIAVVPLRIARGVQNKILEALAMGRPVVATPQALQGLQLQPGQHALTAATPDEWAEMLVRLLGDAALRHQLSRAGRLYVEQHHDWDQCLRPVAALLGLTNGLPSPHDRTLGLPSVGMSTPIDL